MPKGRLLNRCISTSRRIESMSEWAQLLFDRLVIWADDFGRMEGDPVVVRANVKPLSPRTPEEFGRAIAEMISIGAVTAYVAGSRVFLHIDKHDEQQSGLHKRTKSHYPDPRSGNPLDAAAYIAACLGNKPFPEMYGLSFTEEKGTGREEEQEPPVVPLAGDTTPEFEEPEERKGAPATERKRGSREKFEIAHDFQPSPEEREWARVECRMSDAEIDEQTSRFVRHHRAKGNRFKRPDLAWRNWISGRFIGGAKDSHGNRNDWNHRRAAGTEARTGAADGRPSARDFGQRTAADILGHAKR